MPWPPVNHLQAQTWFYLKLAVTQPLFPFFGCQCSSHPITPDGETAPNESIQCENRDYFLARTVIWCAIADGCLVE